MPSDHPLLHHRLLGEPGAPLLVLGPSLGTSLQVWEPQAASLAGQFRVLSFDLPGHGGSSSGVLPTVAPGRTTVDDLAHLVLELVGHHRADCFHYAGISLGGAVGAHLSVHHPDRVASLALVCSSAHFGTAEAWLQRAALVRREAPPRCSPPSRTAGSPTRARRRAPAERPCSTTSWPPTPTATRPAATPWRRTTCAAT
ncbi:alpha/beta fold hydrolase [Streptomyces sp. NPDC101225]|uniref:alpha/beta fold hydrolase n=1 Tax=Streptomyces sp. NPDC101225 TaxID=3366135 RepID=UPI00381E8753